MKISTKFQLNAIFSISIVLGIGAMILLASFQVQKEIENNRFINKITKGIYELNVLTTDYLVHHRVRAKDQWVLRYNSLGKLLTSDSSWSSDELLLLKRIQFNYKKLEISFRQNVNEEESSEELKDMLRNQLLINSQSMFSNAGLLTEESQKQMLETQRNLTLIVISLLLVLMSTLLLVSFLVKKGIINPIAKLQAETRIIGKGNLDYKVDTHEADEIGELSRAFDQMTSQLKKTDSALRIEIEERKQAEQKIVESEHKLRLITDNIPAMIAYVDREERYQFANRKYSEFVSAPMSEILGKSVFSVMGEKPYSTIQGFIQTALSGKQAVYDITLPSFQGPTKKSYLNGNYVPHIENGKIQGFFALIMDISDRKQKEEEIKMLNQELNRQLKELESSNRELNDFAYIASHDLKEPLRAIQAYSEFLVKDYGEIITGEGLTMLDRLVPLCGQMRKLIDTLLFYSRVGRTELAFCEVDLNEKLSEILERLNYTIEEGQTQIKIPQPLPLLYCDEVRIGEVFHNFISNAVKYNNKEEKWIEIGWEGSSTRPTFYIRDNGIGIREKHFESIFRIFKRLHGKDRYGGGVGAGLTLSKKIIERHGGKIWVESTYGEGTTFYFTLQQEIE